MRRRVLTLIGTLIVVSTLGVPVRGAVGAGEPAPELSDVTVSKSHLPTAGGVTILSAATRYARRCTVTVVPAVPEPPPPQTCTGSSVRFPISLPANDTATRVHYRLALTAHGAGHQKVTSHQHVTVGATRHAPTITALTPQPGWLPYVGGVVHIHADVTRARDCAIDLTPAPAAPPPTVDCSAGHGSWAVTLPANATSTAVAYAVDLVVTGAHGKQATTTAPVHVAAHPPPCPGQTDTTPPTTTTYFADPSTHAAADQMPIVNAEINLICDAQLPAGGVRTQIYMAQFSFTLDAVSRALVWAHRYMRADVHLVLDGSNKFLLETDGSLVPNPAYDDVVNHLPGDSVLLCGPNAGLGGRPVVRGGDEESAAFPALTGCAGNNIMHTKLLAVSAIDPAHDPAVLTTAQNFSDNALSSAFNDAIQVVGSAALYEVDAAYVTALNRDQLRPNLGARLSSAGIQLTNAIVASTFGPQNVTKRFPVKGKYVAANDGPTDLVAKTLNAVDCVNPGDFAGTHDGAAAQTKIRIAVLSYGARKGVTAALESLAAAGCDIKIIFASIYPNVRKSLRAAGISVVRLNDNAFPYSDGSGTGPVFVHSKYVLISGGIAGPAGTVTNQDLVLAGSPNLTQNSLHNNDEAGVNYVQTASADPSSVAVYNAFAANWDHLAAIAASIPVDAKPAIHAPLR